jgi:hypothetical protein
MRRRLSWAALPLLLLFSTALVLGKPPKEPPHPPNPPKPPPPPKVKLVTGHVDYELDPTPDLIVRLLNPPVQYDDKGNIKKYIAAELKELKGDNPKLIGYKGDTNDLTTGAEVRVYVVKEAPPPKETDKKDAPKADKPDKPDTATKSEKPDPSKYVEVGELTGQLTVNGNSQKSMTLRVVYEAWEPLKWRPPNNGNQKSPTRLQVGMIVVLTAPAPAAPGK